MSGKPIPEANADTRPFWDACNRGELQVQQCRACGHRQFYPRGLCQRCKSEDLAWQPAEPRGHVYSFTIVHRAPTLAFRADVPYVIALVDLEAGVRMMMNVVNCDPESVAIGMPVNIVFEQRGEQAVPQAEPA